MIFSINSLEVLAKYADQIKSNLSSRGFVVLRGLFDAYEIRAYLPKIYSYLDHAKIIGTTQATRATPRSNSIKWSVGGRTGSQPGNARLMATIYNPLNADDLINFRRHFEKLISIRDIIRNDGKNTGNDHLSDGSFNASRLQIYPEGGGFMLTHTDYVALENSEVQKAPLLQLVLLVTQRGLDFKEGGAYLIHNGKEIDVESQVHSGDILIYDGNSYHGVADIDPFKTLNTASIRGRVVALVTIYN